MGVAAVSQCPTFIVDWYTSHCDGDWEHEQRIRISTLDNPGWRIWANLSETELEGRVMDRRSLGSQVEDWNDYRCARADPTSLAT